MLEEGVCVEVVVGGSEAGVGALLCRRCADELPGVDDEDDEDETAGAGSGTLITVVSVPPRENATADIGAGGVGASNLAA